MPQGKDSLNLFPLLSVFLLLRDLVVVQTYSLSLHLTKMSDQVNPSAPSPWADPIISITIGIITIALALAGLYLAHRYRRAHHQREHYPSIHLHLSQL